MVICSGVNCFLWECEFFFPLLPRINVTISGQHDLPPSPISTKYHVTRCISRTNPYPYKLYSERCVQKMSLKKDQWCHKGHVCLGKFSAGKKEWWLFCIGCLLPGSAVLISIQDDWRFICQAMWGFTPFSVQEFTMYRCHLLFSCFPYSVLCYVGVSGINEGPT